MTRAEKTLLFTLAECMVSMASDGAPRVAAWLKAARKDECPSCDRACSEKPHSLCDTPEFHEGESE